MAYDHIGAVAHIHFKFVMLVIFNKIITVHITISNRNTYLFSFFIFKIYFHLKCLLKIRNLILAYQ